MKKYIKRKIKIILETILTIFILFFINKDGLNNSTQTVAFNNNIDKVLDFDIIKKSQDELYKKSIYTPLYTFVGDLTGYAGDCPLCSGYLACPPRTNVLKEGIYFNDSTYGTVRIVASSKNYPCGTIIRFNVNKLSSEPIIAIILDRGVGGNDIDLLTESETYASKKVGRVKSTSFEVLRNGWNRSE